MNQSAPTGTLCSICSRPLYCFLALVKLGAAVKFSLWFRFQPVNVG